MKSIFENGDVGDLPPAQFSLSMMFVYAAADGPRLRWRPSAFASVCVKCRVNSAKCLATQVLDHRVQGRNNSDGMRKVQRSAKVLVRGLVKFVLALA